MKIIINWFLPLIVALGLFILVRPVLAQTFEGSKSVVVGEESGLDEFKQIYYLDGDNKVFITNSRYTNSGAVTSGRYIAWEAQIEGLWQIFLYDLITKVTTQLTYLNNNVDPKVDSLGRVTWESWVGDTWQVFLFDGNKIVQLTTEDTSLNPSFYQDYIIYGRKNSAGTWRAVVYSMKEGKAIDITTGEKTKDPEIRDGDIFLAAGNSAEEKFPLKVTDLFLLNLTSIEENINLGNPILDELNSTPSGVIEVSIATESAVID